MGGFIRLEANSACNNVDFVDMIHNLQAKFGNTNPGNGSSIGKAAALYASGCPPLFTNVYQCQYLSPSIFRRKREGEKGMERVL